MKNEDYHLFEAKRVYRTMIVRTEFQVQGSLGRIEGVVHCLPERLSVLHEMLLPLSQIMAQFSFILLYYFKLSKIDQVFKKKYINTYNFK